MATTNQADPGNAEFLREVEKIKSHIGERELDDHDLVVLACEEISRTFTREEKQYR